MSETPAARLMKRHIQGNAVHTPATSITARYLIAAVFDLPPELLSTVEPLTSQANIESGSLSRSASSEKDTESKADGEANKAATSCGLCLVAFDDVAHQRRHFRSDWHGYNARRALRGQPALGEDEFEKTVGDLDSSISGSGTSEDEDIPETSSNSRDQGTTKPSDRSSPLLFMASSVLPSDHFLAMYKALINKDKPGSEDAVQYLRAEQLRTSPPGPNGPPSHLSSRPSPGEGPRYFLCMIGGGHFAATIVSPVPTPAKQTTRVDHQPRIIAHKTFHRYTTRRKQGGAQSANDAAKGNAHSAGAGIRRHNEMALQLEIRALLNEWRELIAGCELLFVRASGPANRRTLFGPYEKVVLQSSDPRLRSFPFSTRRPTKRELLRAFTELATVKIVHWKKEEQHAKVEKARASGTTSKSETTTAADSARSEEEEAALLHTTQLQTMIKRAKAPAILRYLEGNGLSPGFEFYPPENPSNHHAPTILHSAARQGIAVVVTSLLLKGNADPTTESAEGRTPCDLASDRATRDAFRIARFELGEQRWDWDRARCPPAMSRIQVEERVAAERQEDEQSEMGRRRTELERMKSQEAASAKIPSQMPSGPLKGQMSGSDAREQEVRGLPPDVKMRLEREKRARAAEERLKRLTRQ